MEVTRQMKNYTLRMRIRYYKMKIQSIKQSVKGSLGLLDEVRLTEVIE